MKNTYNSLKQSTKYHIKYKIVMFERVINKFKYIINVKNIYC